MAAPAAGWRPAGADPAQRLHPAHGRRAVAGADAARAAGRQHQLPAQPGLSADLPDRGQHRWRRCISRMATSTACGRSCSRGYRVRGPGRDGPVTLHNPSRRPRWALALDWLHRLARPGQARALGRPAGTGPGHAAVAPSSASARPAPCRRCGSNRAFRSAASAAGAGGARQPRCWSTRHLSPAAPAAAGGGERRRRIARCSRRRPRRMGRLAPLAPRRSAAGSPGRGRTPAGRQPRRLGLPRFRAPQRAALLARRGQERPVRSGTAPEPAVRLGPGGRGTGAGLRPAPGRARRSRPATAPRNGSAAWRRSRVPSLRPRLAALPRETRDTLFLLAVIAWVLLLQAGQLPVWCSARAGPAARARLAGAAAARAAALELAHRAAGCWPGRDLARLPTLLGQQPGVALVTLLLALKTLELRAPDAFVIFFLGFFVLLTRFFHSQSLPTALGSWSRCWV